MHIRTSTWRIWRGILDDLLPRPTGEEEDENEDGMTL
jgi:hypothetical protein